jgi:hypothetical protein
MSCGLVLAPQYLDAVRVGVFLDVLLFFLLYLPPAVSPSVESQQQPAVVLSALWPVGLSGICCPLHKVATICSILTSSVASILTIIHSLFVDRSLATTLITRYFFTSQYHVIH